MAILPIVMHPDPILEKECEKVTAFDKKLKKLLNNMYDTMIEADGVGLAAPQVGVDLQVAIVDIGDDSGTIELINPEIIEVNGSQTDLEGCLSFPGLYGEVTRPDSIKVRTYNRKGKLIEFHAKDFMARAIQHEIDHLNGILFTSKIERYVTEEELERYESE
ncbi:peptide deformylase [Rossellomorea aquimaris]|uniref:peptide deformylase n=1 Tax=Rossellomorea aquimaris TaxID=189382 RepID=UPI001CD49515|nr:peptide deformylase [Rossellomorea aquimaris]MCA1053461.1 peptide deformylase [Rossellomorea aquimaris]